MTKTRSILPLTLVLALITGAGCASTPPRPAERPCPEPMASAQEAPPTQTSGAPISGLAPLPLPEEAPPSRPPASALTPLGATSDPAQAVGGEADSADAPLSVAAGCPALVGGRALRRSALRRTLDAGLGTWLRSVDIDPKVDRGRFQGWLIRGIYGGDACWSEADLRVGDIVTRINRRPIQRPEDAQALWTALRSSGEIVVDVLREGKARTLRFPVVDDRN